MERSLARSILGPTVNSLDEVVIEGSGAPDSDKRRARDYKNRLGSVDWTF
jgi:hypothetical protein